MITTVQQTEIIEALLKHLNERYVFPDVARAIEGVIRDRMVNGEYDDTESLPQLCRTLTEQLQAVSRDEHLRVLHRESPIPMREGQGPSPEWVERYRQKMLLENGGFRTAERLAGNVGYLEFHNFARPDYAGESAVAAMNFLANTSALIVDLRQNTGGHPGMVALITSYLFDQPVHLNSIYSREHDQFDQFWTLPYVPGRRFGGDKPVYVLTSSKTFSAAEEFVYNLKSRERATIIGEVTRGGAHPGGLVRLHDHVEVFIPSARSVNPVTGTNWEGAGVQPDVAAPADKAQAVAYVAALRKVITGAGEAPEGPLKELVVEAKQALSEAETSLG
ncbi:MAG: peptidase [Firmicutes bacterium]|nr:peptidase [Bacillota bacterium]